MAGEKLTKSDAFSVVIDPEINHFLNLAMQMAMENPNYGQTVFGKGLKEASERFFKQMVRGVDATKMEDTIEVGDSKYLSGEKKTHRQLIGEAEQQQTYTLVMDEPRDRVLNIMMQAAKKHPGYMRSLKAHGILEVEDALLGEIADSSHDAGMCDDPNCLRPNK